MLRQEEDRDWYVPCTYHGLRALLRTPANISQPSPTARYIECQDP